MYYLYGSKICFLRDTNIDIQIKDALCIFFSIFVTRKCDIKHQNEEKMLSQYFGMFVHTRLAGLTISETMVTQVSALFNWCNQKSILEYTISQTSRQMGYDSKRFHFSTGSLKVTTWATRVSNAMIVLTHTLA